MIKKKSKELQIKGNYFNVIKAICKKPTENIILKDERGKAFPRRLGTRRGWPLSPVLVNIILGILADNLDKK